MKKYSNGELFFTVFILLLFLGIGIWVKSTFLLIFSIISFIYIIVLLTSKKKYVYKVSDINFEEEAYFRDIIKKYSIAELSYIDGFDLDNPKDIICALLKLEKEKVIKIEDNKIKILNKEKVLKKSEKYLLNHISDGVLRMDSDLEYINLVEKECTEDKLIEMIPYDNVLKSVSLDTLLGEGLIRAKLLDEGKDIYEKLSGLKKFLLDFSNMEERERASIVLWEDYLIYSVLFGINKKVMDEYKEMIEIGHYMTLNEILTMEYENSETYRYFNDGSK